MRRTPQYQSYQARYYSGPQKHYGFFHLCVDFILVMATGGLWLIWLLIKFLRNGVR